MIDKKQRRVANGPLGLHLLTLAEKYFLLVENVLKETIRHQNKHVLVEKITDGESSWDNYEAKTRWSDFNILIPVLFNLYHGIELLLKGLLSYVDSYDLQAHHDVQELLEDFRKHFAEEIELVKTLESYLVQDSLPELLAKCLYENNLSVKDFYIFLRYPSDRRFQKLYDYFPLKYNSTSALPFFNNVVSDIDILLRGGVRLYHSISEKLGIET